MVCRPASSATATSRLSSSKTTVVLWLACAKASVACGRGCDRVSSLLGAEHHLRDNVIVEESSSTNIANDYRPTTTGYYACRLQVAAGLFRRRASVA